MVPPAHPTVSINSLLSMSIINNDGDDAKIVRASYILLHFHSTKQLVPRQ